ncbi:MAG: hypothetical protein ACYCV6_13940 [Steroidobacteraceae bacterium]
MARPPGGSDLDGEVTGSGAVALRDERLQVRPSSFRAMRDGIGNPLRRGPFDVLCLVAPACRS